MKFYNGNKIKIKCLGKVSIFYKWIFFFKEKCKKDVRNK